MKKFEVTAENVKKVGDFLREIRESKGYSMNQVEVYTGIQRSEIKKIEEGAKKKINPLYLKELAKFYNIDLLELFRLVGYTEEFEKKSKDREFKVYDFITDSNGEINKEIFEKKIIPLSNERGEQISKNGYVIKIVGDKMRPYFYDNDLIAFLKMEFENWQKLDNKIIMVEINGKYFIKKLIFENGTPYLYTFNERLYPKESINDLKNLKFIAIPRFRLSIDLDNFSL